MTTNPAQNFDAPQPAPEEELEGVSASTKPARSRGWTFAALCIGIALVACCMLIPQTDFNRRLSYQGEELRRDLESIEKQVAVNEQFLERVASDPALAERLAQRQMKIVRKGTRVLELNDGRSEEMSPFQLLSVPPPAPLEPYQPKGGLLASLCYGERTRLYMLGTGLFLMAAGLIVGFAPVRD